MRAIRLHGMIERCILVNYRLDPSVLAAMLPPPLRPRIYRGYGIASVCLLRLCHVRPRFVPKSLGFSWENAPHCLEVAWEHDGKVRTGVYLPERLVASHIGSLLASMLLSGESHVANFKVVEEAERVSVTISRNGQREFMVCGEVSNSLPATSLFPSLEQASIFFQQGPLGLSATGQAGCFDAVELQCENWNPIAMHVSRVESSFFDDHTIFPPGSVEFDSALLVRNVVHRWCRRGRVGKPAKFPVVEAISPVQRARASRSMPHRAILLDAEKE